MRHLAATLALAAALFLPALAADENEHKHDHAPYAGQQTRPIKSLSAQDIEGLQKGAGTPFGGMAKPAELNGYPGPRHVLDAHTDGSFPLTDSQLAKTKALYDRMRAEAIALGQQLIATEQELDNAFSGKTITADTLRQLTQRSAQTQAKLRQTHLRAHLEMIAILTQEQIASYNTLRGYDSEDPCAAPPPPGHPKILWRLHNNCD